MSSTSRFPAIDQYINYITALAADAQMRKQRLYDLARRVRKYYDKHEDESGGRLHVVIADDNVDDDSILYCVHRCVEDEDIDGLALTVALLCLPGDERLVVIDAAKGRADCHVGHERDRIESVLHNVRYTIGEKIGQRLTDEEFASYMRRVIGAPHSDVVHLGDVHWYDWPIPSDGDWILPRKEDA